MLYAVAAVQVWDDHGLRNCLNLTALNKHGRVYDDGEKHQSQLQHDSLHFHISITDLFLCFSSPVWLFVMVRVREKAIVRG